ncbi:MAG: FG-GAP-like repeat-containing protein [Elusimicrobiota bacterium]
MYAGFSDSGITIIGYEDSVVAWGDYDNDGYYDFAISGKYATASSARKTSVYRNNGSGDFTLAQDLGEGIYSGDLDWGDYDNDGDLDLAIAGHVGDSVGMTKIYNNVDGVFTDSGISLQKVFSSALAWGDYDNDGDLDLALTGTSNTFPYYFAIIYKNDGAGGFTDSGISNLKGVTDSDVAWGDYNNDGFLDLALTGRDADYEYSNIYKNNGNGTFTDISAGITGMTAGCFIWGDYDNDGYLDFAISGYDTPGGAIRRCKVYRNSGSGTFESTATLTGINFSKMAWGDYDNDGDLDLITCGKRDNADFLAWVYQNNGGANFVVVSTLTAAGDGVERGGIAFCDYDNDRDLDIILTGATESTDQMTKIYDNDKAVTTPNIIPPQATVFHSRYYNKKLYIMWDDPAPGSEETPIQGLYYNFRIGSSSGTGDLVPARYGSPLLGNYMTKVTSSTVSDPDIAAGRLDVSAHKNIRVLNISGSNYYWAVQSIDTSLGFTWAESYGAGWSVQQVFIDSTTPTGMPTVPLEESMFTYTKDLTFTWTKGTADDPETGIYGCYLEIRELDGVGNETLVVDKEISENMTEKVWQSDGSATYEIEGNIDSTYYARVKARHGYEQAIPISIYKPGTYGTADDPDGLWVSGSPHYTAWTEWSAGIKIVELLKINNNIIRNPGSENDAVEIWYALEKDANVKIRIFNILGELVKVVFDQYVTMGSESIQRWYGYTDGGDVVASGVYFVNVQSGSKEDTQKVIVVK